MKLRSFFFILISFVSVNVFSSCDESEPQTSNMIIYSVTTKVDNSILKEWLAWVDGHVAHVLETDRFAKATLSKVNGLDDSLGPTYNIQFWAYNAESLEQYRKIDAPALKEGTLAKFPTGLTNTRIEMKVIKSFKNKK